jgi:hypothetical protein
MTSHASTPPVCNGGVDAQIIVFLFFIIKTEKTDIIALIIFNEIILSLPHQNQPKHSYRNKIALK